MVNRDSSVFLLPSYHQQHVYGRQPSLSPFCYDLRLDDRLEWVLSKDFLRRVIVGLALRNNSFISFRWWPQAHDSIVLRWKTDSTQRGFRFSNLNPSHTNGDEAPGLMLLLSSDHRSEGPFSLWHHRMPSVIIIRATLMPSWVHGERRLQFRKEVTEVKSIYELTA